MLNLATELGGTKLDCFDTVLPKIYGAAGFVETGRDPWNEEYKPEGWNYDTFKAFARDTLKQGTSHFMAPVLVGGATYETRRVYLDGGKYVAQPVGRDWSVSATLCIFPAA